MNALATAPVQEAASQARLHDFDQLFQTHYVRIVRVIGRIVRDRARAEELAADVFVKWRARPAAHGEGAEGWLYRAAVRKGLDAWRRERRWDQVQRVFSRLRVPPRTPEQLHAAMSRQSQVRTVLGTMQRQTALLLLLWAEECSYSEIAAAAGVRPSSVGTLLKRAQNTFRKAYEARYGTYR